MIQKKNQVIESLTNKIENKEYSKKKEGFCREKKECMFTHAIDDCKQFIEKETCEK